MQEFTGISFYRYFEQSKLQKQTKKPTKKKTLSCEWLWSTLQSSSSRLSVWSRRSGSGRYLSGPAPCPHPNYLSVEAQSSCWKQEVAGRSRWSCFGRRDTGETEGMNVWGSMQLYSFTCLKTRGPRRCRWCWCKPEQTPDAPVCSGVRKAMESKTCILSQVIKVFLKSFLLFHMNDLKATSNRHGAEKSVNELDFLPLQIPVYLDLWYLLTLSEKLVFTWPTCACNL